MNQSPKNINAANQNNIRINYPRQKSLGSLGQISNQSPFHTKINLQSRVKQSSMKEINRDKLIEQNKRLKNQVLLLAQQMDEIISKGEDKKKKYGINLQQLFDPQTEVQRLQTKKQEFKILQLKNQLFQLKKEIQYVYDERTVIQKQNSIKQMENQIKILESEKAALMKVRKEQQKALNFLKNDTKYNQKIQKSKSQLSKLKQECKVLFAKTSENEKLLLKAHQKLVSKTKKIKQVEQKIKQNKQKIKKGNPNIVTIQMISQIENQIGKLQSEYKQSQKNWLQKINNLDIEYNNRRIEEQKKLLILKQKEREVKINQIKLKQFRKLIYQQRSQSKIDSIDNREFRNKRNIKFLQKSN